MAAPSPSSPSVSTHAADPTDGPLLAPPPPLPHQQLMQDPAAHRRPGSARKDRACTAKDRISRMLPCAAGKRSSIYRGVTRHRWTGRYEAHLWDKSTWNQNQNKKGKQVYLGAYDDEEAAARAYDLAALKYWGAKTLINFPVEDYARDIEEMQAVSKEDYLVSLRRKSSAFSKGFPKYRGLPRHLQNSKWDPSLAQIDNAASMEGKYLGAFGFERKVDLTNFIRWWVPKKARQAEPKSEDVGDEIYSLECSMIPAEPYKFPSLGPVEGAEPDSGPGLSACDALSHSEAFRAFAEKASMLHEEKDYMQNADLEPMKVFPLLAGENERSINIGLTELLTQRAPYPLSPLIATMPPRPSWNIAVAEAAAPASDPLFWNSFVLPPDQNMVATTAATTDSADAPLPPTSGCF